MSNGNGHRWSKFWWQDWQNDQDLRLCSLAAQGLWIRLLCIMHEADGRLIVHGTSPTDVVISALVGVKPREIRRHLDELLRFKVAKISDDGVIYCQRMINDIKASEAGREAVSLRRDRAPPTRGPSDGAGRPPASSRIEEKRIEETRATRAREGKAVFNSDSEGKQASDDRPPTEAEVIAQRQAHIDALKAMPPAVAAVIQSLGASMRHKEYAPGWSAQRSPQEQKNQTMPQPKPTPAYLAGDTLRIMRRIHGIAPSSLDA